MRTRRSSLAHPLTSAAPLALAALLAALAATACGGDEAQAPAATTATGTTSTGTGGAGGGEPATVDDIMAELPQSCAFSCGECAEPDEPFACPTLKPWADLPHADACGAWDGAYPTPQKGQCTASTPTGDAVRKTGPIEGGYVLPDGHAIKPLGREVVFEEADVLGGLPQNLALIPGTKLALSTDACVGDDALRLLDLDALAGDGYPVLAHIEFPKPTALFYGLATPSEGRVLASGGGDGTIYAFDVDAAKGTLVRAKARDLALGLAGDKPWFSGAIATTKDGKRLVVAPAEYASEIVVLSLEDADYGKKLQSIAIDTARISDLRLDPFDPAGTTFYATDFSKERLLEIDAATGKLVRAVALEGHPTQVAFLDATYAIVSEATGDTFAIVDRAKGTVASRPTVLEKDAPHGLSPTAMVYDAAKQRLYAALSMANAVEVFDVAGSPPTVTPRGRIPTAWLPTSLALREDGSLVVLNGKGHGTGTDGKPYPWASGPITDRMRGSVQLVPAAALEDLEAATKTADAGLHLESVAGRPEVTCPGGAYDFPVPKDNTSGPSPLIKHVILVVRENKTFDAVFGDLPDVDGDPKLVMAGDAERQAAIWKNARKIAQGFVNFDNFYTNAEQSLQGHTWTVFGRTTDYMERAWVDIWGRATRPITTAVSAEAAPLEGGVFVWLTKVGVPNQNMGEIVDVGPAGPDSRYPGYAYAQNRPDTDKSCYMAGRIRLTCDLPSFVYAVQANDHTYGAKAGSAAPEVMIAVNDEATGLLLDGLSHSPIWKDSLLIVTEDDPQDGGDHVDLHRAPLFMASPWVKRGYVSHTHVDMAAVYKMVANIYGVPYNNAAMEHAVVPFDAFTSTPDYTPYTYEPRSVTAPCNGPEGNQALAAESWDFDDLDDQPGLSQQIGEMLREPAGRRGVRVIAPKPRR
jgi:DNA-binding beta-propeller fold protein YncE